MDVAAAVHRKAADLGKLTVRMTAKAGSGHPSSALSLAHVVTQLMYVQMRYDPADPADLTADRLVLSEGHAVPIIYAAYADLGGAIRAPGGGGNPGGASSAGAGVDPPGRLTPPAVDDLRALDSVLDGHPNPAEGVPFFDAATGSLGQGLSVAAGLALAARLDRSPRRVYCVVGDGEAREGQIWEALDFIVDHRLTSVVAVFNCNGQGQAGHVSAQQSAERLAGKLVAFGFDAQIVDGHDAAALAAAFERCAGAKQLVAIVAKTVKGWGVDALQKGNWHGKPLKESDLADADASLDRAAACSGGAGKNDGTLPRPTPRTDASTLAPRPSPRDAEWPPFHAAMRSAGLDAALQKNGLATRRAYGAALKLAGDLLPQVVCLDGDVSNSTFADVFAAAHPERFFECKIAEQNMISAAVGLAAAGYIPFCNSFAKFIARAYDQVELASISRANLKIVGSHSGITPCSDGPSQMGLLDVAYFRSFTTVRGDDRTSPLCWFFQPADAVAAYHCTRLMVGLSGLCYMRTHRPDVPLIYAPDATFTPGGFGVIRAGEDLALVSSGYMVHVALRAAELLARQNIRASVLDAYSLPLEIDRFLEALQRAGKRALVIEDNYGGGFAAAVAELAARAGEVRVEAAHVQRIPKSARLPEEELDYCGVGPAQVADRALALLARPR